jgi:valyl-tRNA synthetase
VYVHALVRDERGAKMSKSKGNVLDPLDLVDKYGADALRFTLSALAAPGRDIKLVESRIEGYRNFGTKLWNASRFCQMNECFFWEPFEPAAAKEPLNLWIYGETRRTAVAVQAQLEAYRFNDAAQTLYQFVWNTFCDWYVELAKPILNGDDDARKSETRRCAAWTLDAILVLLHPMMPFITEELWQRLAAFGPQRAGPLIQARWPRFEGDGVDTAAAEAEIAWIIALISEVRSMRAALNVSPGARIPLLLLGAAPETARRLERYQDVIDRLARLEYSIAAESAPAGAVTFVLEEAVVALPLSGFIDFAQESTRLRAEIARLAGEEAKWGAKLANPQFVERAPPEVVEEHQERVRDAAASREKLAAALSRLETAS